MSSPKKADWPIIAGTILVLMIVAMGVYVGGYFAMSEVSEPGARLPIRDGYVELGDGYRARIFRYEWQKSLYAPAVKIEHLLGGVSFSDGFAEPDEP